MLGSAHVSHSEIHLPAFQIVAPNETYPATVSLVGKDTGPLKSTHFKCANFLGRTFSTVLMIGIDEMQFSLIFPLSTIPIINTVVNFLPKKLTLVSAARAYGAAKGVNIGHT